jgi:hypothetical protein
MENFYDTWFGKRHLVIRASGCERTKRTYWMNESVEMFTGNLVPMHKKNPDGSIDILGAEIITLRPGMRIGSYDREGLQKSLVAHAEYLKSEGARIVKKTKNILIARYKNETAKYVISRS